MGKGNKKSSARAKGGDKKIVLQEPEFSNIEDKKSNISEETEELSIGDKKLQKELEKRRKYEEEEEQRRAETALNKKLEKKKTKNTKVKDTPIKSVEKSEKLEKDYSSYTKLNRKEDKSDVSSSNVIKQRNICKEPEKESKIFDNSDHSSWAEENKEIKQDNESDKRCSKNLRDDDKFQKRHHTESQDNDEGSLTRSNIHNQYIRQDDKYDRDNYKSHNSSQPRSKSMKSDYVDQRQNKYQSKYENNERFYRNKHSQSNSDFKRGKNDHNSYTNRDYDKTSSDPDYRNFEYGLKKPFTNYKRVLETKGDLFSAPEEYSLAHCVAEDFSMGAGIAIQFRKKFGKVAELLTQNVSTGGSAVIKHKDRFIYYLVTKKWSYSKPTLPSLWNSLKEMKNHMVENQVTKLAIPQIGCGLDRLDWGNVKQMLEYIFKDVEVEITVYNLDFAETSSDSKPRAKKGYKTHAPYPLIDIETGTGLIYFGTQDAYVSEEIKCLETKYHGFTSNYKTELKSIGDVIRTELRGEVLYGLIVRRTKDDRINFMDLEKCFLNLKIMNRTDKFEYFGFDAPYESDMMFLEKFINVVQSVLVDSSIYICWPEKIRTYMPSPNY